MSPPDSDPQTPVPDLPDLPEYQRQRACGDLGPRTRTGALFCALGCAITAGVGHYFEHQPVLAGTALLLFAVLALLRWQNRPPADMADRAAAEGWWRRHWALLVATSAVWCGFLLAVGQVEGLPGTTVFTAAMVTVAFTTASGESLALDTRRALVMISLQQLPAYAWWAFALPELRALVMVLLAFYVYQALHIRRRGKEYQLQVRTEHSLMVSQAVVERLSRQDALTGLANRREYESRLRSAWEHAARVRGPLSLLMIDLDHFKRINDSLGHPAGDACLKHVAMLLAGQFKRSLDTVARIGGEEFAVVLPGVEARAAQGLAELACAALAHSPLLHEGQTLVATASLGVASVSWAQDASADALVSRADAACYAAKTQGRNRVVVA